jgi:hypothetical protein
MKRPSSLSPCLSQVPEQHDDSEILSKKIDGKDGEVSSSTAVSSDTFDLRNDDFSKELDRMSPIVIEETLKIQSAREHNEEIMDGGASISRVSVEDSESVRRKLSRLGKKLVAKIGI